MLLRFHHFRHPWRSHVVSRFVRRAWLWGMDEYAGRDYSHRKEWVLERLALLTSIFAIEVCAFAVMSNHYHVVLFVDQKQARDLTNEQIIERWTKIFGTPNCIRRYLTRRKFAATCSAGARQARSSAASCENDQSIPHFLGLISPGDRRLRSRYTSVLRATIRRTCCDHRHRPQNRGGRETG